jgi:putative redox protein
MKLNKMTTINLKIKVMTASIVYEGELRCTAKHLQSGSEIETDAPTDNRGKGERFSPTDMVCVSLATCIITTMGIRATDMNIDLKGTRIDVTKHMLSNPRRIGKISIALHLPGKLIGADNRLSLERVGNHCPVKNSLHPDLELDCQYHWDSFIS